jgi:Holliday junction resolvase RusA-like endonuclease
MTEALTPSNAGVLAHIVLLGKPTPYNAMLAAPSQVWDPVQKRFKTLQRFYNPNAKKIEAEKWKIKLAYRGRPYDGKVHIEFGFYFKPSSRIKAAQRDKMYGQEHAEKPDIDNLIKFYNDLLKGIVFTDDKKVTRLIDPVKRWAREPKTEIFVYYGE